MQPPWAWESLSLWDVPQSVRTPPPHLKTWDGGMAGSSSTRTEEEWLTPQERRGPLSRVPENEWASASERLLSGHPLLILALSNHSWDTKCSYISKGAQRLSKLTEAQVLHWWENHTILKFMWSVCTLPVSPWTQDPEKLVPLLMRQWFLNVKWLLMTSVGRGEGEVNSDQCGHSRDGFLSLCLVHGLGHSCLINSIKV